MTAEEWRTIPGIADYMASSHGRIRSHRRTPGGHVLTPSVNSNRGGYFEVAIRSKAGKATRTVHSLVAAAFHGERPQGAVTRHLDGDPLNNKPENLRWGSQSENVQDMLRHGTGPKKWSMGRDTCRRGHPFTPENTSVRVERQLWVCRQCDRELTAARRARKRLEIAAAKNEAAA